MTLGKETAHPRQLERAVRSRGEIVELFDERTAVRGAASSGVEFRLERDSSHLCKGAEPPATNLKAVCRKKRKLSSSGI